MGNPERRIELRRHHRFQLQQGAIAVLSCESRVRLGLVSDISRGGLAFSYIDHLLDPRIAPGEPAQLRLTWHERDFHLKNVDCQVVMEQEIMPENSFIQLPMKKCRVKFLELTAEHMAQLNALLASFSPEPFHHERILGCLSA